MRITVKNETKNTTTATGTLRISEALEQDGLSFYLHILDLGKEGAIIEFHARDTEDLQTFFNNMETLKSELIAARTTKR